MIPAIVRLVNGALGHRAPRQARLKDLAAMRLPLMAIVDDCPGKATDQLKAPIELARTPQEIWMPRLDAFQIISQQHNQTEAAKRVDGIAHCFDGWLDPRQLARAR